MSRGPNGRDARRDFILANTRLIAPPLTPTISLWLAAEAVPLWQKTEEELGAMGLPARFWSERAALTELFPRGLDVLLACGDVLAALPRSTRAVLQEVG